MRRIISLFGFLLLALILSISPGIADERLKIGVSVPLSGTAVAYGVDIKNALLFANRRLANNSYDLIIEDDRCSDRDAVQIAHKLVEVDKVNYVLGFGCSGTVLASAPVYERAKAVVIASGTGAPLITFAGDYIFRTKPSLTLAADLLAKDMASKFKKVGIISEETAYCKGLAEAVTKKATSLKVEVLNENFLSETEDFRTLLLKLRSRGVEAVFLNPQGESGMITLFKQFLALSWKIQIYGTFTPGSPVFLDAMKNSANGIIYADLAFNEDMLNTEGLALWRDFVKEFGKVNSADHYAALSMAAFSALHEALQSGKNVDVKNYLYSHTFNQTVDGFSFDENGDVVSNKLSYVLKVIKEGGPARYLN